MPKLLKSWILIALGVLIAAHVIPGISYEHRLGTLLVVVMLLSACNMLIKPILVFFTLPFIVVTFGLGLWVINALLLLLVGRLVDGFVVTSFGSALGGALIISFTSFLANVLLSPRGKKDGFKKPPRVIGGAQRRKEDDVIDI